MSPSWIEVKFIYRDHQISLPLHRVTIQTSRFKIIISLGNLTIHLVDIQKSRVEIHDMLQIYGENLWILVNVCMPTFIMYYTIFTRTYFPILIRNHSKDDFDFFTYLHGHFPETDICLMSIMYCSQYFCNVHTKKKQLYIYLQKCL